MASEAFYQRKALERKVRRVQELRRSNAAGKHRMASLCEHERVYIGLDDGVYYCADCSEDLSTGADDAPEWTI